MAADTYSATLGVILMGTGNDNNSWGTNANTLAFQILEDAIANALTSAVTGGTLDLSGSPPPAAATQVRYAALIFTGALGSNQTIQVPNLTKWWYVSNQTSGAFTLKFKTPSGSASTAIPQNSGWQVVMCDGSNGIVVYPANSKQIQMPDGSASAPAYSDINETNSGWYRNGTQDWRLSINGNDVFQVTGAGAGSPSIVNALSPNLLQQQGAGVAGISGAITTGHVAKWASATALADAGLASAYLDSTAYGFDTPRNLSLSVTHTGGNLLQIAVKNAAGSDASATSSIQVPFQTVSAGKTTGGVSLVNIAAALSMTTNSTSATLGIVNNIIPATQTPFRIWIALFNNAGTAVPAVWHSGAAATTTAINSLMESGVASTTGISSSATSAGVWYTPNGTSLSNCAFRLIGYCEYTGGLATVGSFTADPTNTVLFGPGVKKPGDLVQEVAPGPGSGTNASITPSSAINLVRVTVAAQQNGTTAAGVSQMNGTSALKRGTSGGTTIQTINPIIYGSNSGQTTGVPVAFRVLDSPGTAASQQYTVVAGGNAATHTNISFDLEEIMG